MGLEKTTHHLIQMCFFSILIKDSGGDLKAVVQHRERNKAHTHHIYLSLVRTMTAAPLNI